MPADPNQPELHGTDSAHGDSLVVLGQASSTLAPLGWYGGPPSPPEILTGGLDPIWLFHSLRRRWVLAVGLALLAAAGTAWLVWLITPKKADATALIKVASHKPQIAFSVDEGSNTEFNVYKRTQIALFTAPRVLQAALRDQEIARLPSLRDEPDPVEWLRENLEVTFPGNSEIMRVSLDGEDPDEVKKIVDAATKAYMEEVVYADRQNRLARKDALERSYQKTNAEIEKKTQTYNQLAREFYTTESHEANVDRQLALAELELVRNERKRIEQELARETLAQDILQANRSNPDRRTIAIARLLDEDPQIRAMRQQLVELELMIGEEQTRAVRSDAPSLVRLAERRRTLAGQIARRQSQLRPRIELELENMPDTDFKTALNESKLRENFLTLRGRELDQQYAALTEKIKQLGDRSLELESLKAELEQLRKIARSMGSKVEAWEIELDSDERITLFQEAIVTHGLDNLQRYVLVSFGGLVGFGLTCFGIALWDFQARRLNGPHQVDEGLGIRVIGQLPPLRGQKQIGDTNPKVAALMEAVDNVRTTLMHVGNSKPTRVVMVTSAASREGRTTVASQLAASLARAGRKTLLLDADMRHPTLQRIFDVSLEDGLCELLRGETSPREAVHATHDANLFLLTAGRCDAASIQALARDHVGPILDELRTEFEFVVIDAAPVRNLADSLIIGQHVDGVILSVLRDTSKVPDIHETNERLKNVGIRVIGSVVNGVPPTTDHRTGKGLLVSGS